MNTLWGWGRASWAGCGPDVRRGGQTLIMGYSADKSPLIGHLAGPLRRLEPLGAQRQEKCGPNRPTPTGYSCNNALASPAVNRTQKNDKDAAEWLPALNQCWFADRVVAVRQRCWWQQ